MLRIHGQMWMGVLGCLLTAGLGTAVAAEPTAPQGRPIVDSTIGSYVAKAVVSGKIAITGSDTMQPIVAKMASAFRDWQPNVKVAVQGGGTGAALEAFLQGLAGSRRGDGNVKGHLSSNDVALLAASRPLTEAERGDFRSRYGYDVTEIPIAMDAIAVYVNRRNPVEGLTLEQLDAMFSDDRKRGAAETIETWGQAGVKGEWAHQPVHRYGQDERSGTRAIFIQKVLQDGRLRTDVRIKSGPASEILALGNDALGIGYVSIGFQASTVRIVPLAERMGAPFVTPSPASVADGTYPLSRQLYLYAKKDPKSGLKPEVLEFLKFINSREGQDMAVKAGAYPLPVHQVANNLHVLTGAATTAAEPGTPFVISKK
jgi:phosphate transport system substrate-binding protein